MEDAAFDARELCRLCCKADPGLRQIPPCQRPRSSGWRSFAPAAPGTSPYGICWASGIFLDFTVEVGPGVLIPRADTECVAQTTVAALKRAAARPGREDEPAGLDLCAGTGVLAIALARGVPAAPGDGRGKKAARRFLSCSATALRWRRGLRPCRPMCSATKIPLRRTAWMSLCRTRPM